MSCNECQVIDGIGIIPVDEIGVPPHEFAYCDELNSIVIPKGISVIGSLAHIEFPRELHTIGWYAFSDCINLEDIEFPDGLAIIGDFAFSGCRKLRSVIIPEGVREVGDDAFAGCEILKEVVFKGSNTIVGVSTFEYCDVLDNIIVPCGSKSFYMDLLPENLHSIIFEHTYGDVSVNRK